MSNLASATTSRAPRLDSIDLLKGLAIVAVIAQHSLTGLRGEGAGFWAYQAVPVFMVLMGFNAVQSSDRKPESTSIRGSYSRTYLKSRLSRLFLPFAAAWMISLVVGLAVEKVHFGPLLLVGVLPLAGPGNYFVTALAEFTLIYPALYVALCRWPKRTLLALGITDVLFEVAVGALHLAHGTGAYLYQAAIPRYGCALALGVWMAQRKTTAARPPGWLIAWATIGVTFVAADLYSTGSFNFFVQGFERTTNFVVAGYSTALCLLAYRYFPTRARSIPGRSLAELGRASYQVFLAQMVWFAAQPKFGWWSFALGLMVSSFAGVLAYEAQRHVQPTKIPRSPRSQTGAGLTAT